MRSTCRTPPDQPKVLMRRNRSRTNSRSSTRSVSVVKTEGIGLPQRHSTLSSASTSPLVAARTAQSTLLTS